MSRSKDRYRQRRKQNVTEPRHREIYTATTNRPNIDIEIKYCLPTYMRLLRTTHTLTLGSAFQIP